MSPLGDVPSQLFELSARFHRQWLHLYLQLHNCNRDTYLIFPVLDRKLANCRQVNRRRWLYCICLGWFWNCTILEVIWTGFRILAYKRFPPAAEHPPLAHLFKGISPFTLAGFYVNSANSFKTCGVPGVIKQCILV